MVHLVQTAHAANGIEVQLAPPAVGHLGGLPLTATLLTAWLCIFVLLILSARVKRKLALMPGKLQNVLEMLIGGAFDYTADVLESRKLARQYFPIIMTIFMFVLAMNWIELIPGVDSIGFWQGSGAARHLVPLFYPPSADLNNTAAIALISFVMVEFAGITIIGIKKYSGKFFNFSSPLGFVIGLIELISEFVRIVAFSFRLFGNIFAGKVLMMVVMFLATAYLVPVPFMAYEAFVGLIQAFIFAVLTLYFLKLAVMDPHAQEAH